MTAAEEQDKAQWSQDPNLCAVEAEGGVWEGEVRLLELVDPIAEIVVLLIEGEVEICTECKEEHHRLYRHDVRVTKGHEEAPWIERDEAGLCFRHSMHSI